MRFHPIAMTVAAALLLSTVLPWAAEVPSRLGTYNVVWTSPSESSAGSMPLGNGDIGLNVWVEKSGDLLFYISKTDAWSDNIGGNKGLLKLCRVRVRLSPALSVAEGAFRQTLVLREGAIEVQGGPTSLRIWVDANRPLVRVEATGPDEFQMQVGLETLRPTPEKEVAADTILEGQKDRIVWFYRNRNRQISQLQNLTFGAILQGDNLVGVDRTTLRSAHPVAQASFSVYPLTAQTDTPEQWLAQAERQAARAGPGDWAAHCVWWRQFWERSWVFVSGAEEARKVTSFSDLSAPVVAGARIRSSSTVRSSRWTGLNARGSTAS